MRVEAGAPPRPYELVLPDRSRVPLTGAVTIGRAGGNTVRFDDPTVSRRHARIVATSAGATLEDSGSTSGTWLDGVRVARPVLLGDGSRIRVGDQELVVERPRRDEEASRTIHVPVAPDRGADHPRLRPGSRLKRLEASEGARRWVLRDGPSGRLVRLGDADGRLLELVDGRRSVSDLMREAERRAGAEGPPQLLRLIGDLADRDFLEGAGGDGSDAEIRGLRRLLVPREWAWSGAGDWFEALYHRGGRLLLRPPALALAGLVAVGGAAVYGHLVARRYGTPFVVADHVGIGGAVFLLGRLALAAAHETAHGLARAAFGRRPARAGLKLVVVFPYAFVDTSEAWFEPRRRRIAVSAAGPASDGLLGGVFALLCLALPAGAPRDVCFQLALAAYVGALANLNPLVERDGYHVLADAVGDPALRRHARAELVRRMRGEPAGTRSRGLLAYGACGLVWSTVVAVLAILVSLRYAPALETFVPGPVVAALLASVWAALLIPLAAILAPAALERRRRRRRS